MESLSMSRGGILSDLGGEDTYLSWFAAAVKRAPLSLAVRAGSGNCNYEELNRQSNQLGRYLQALGVEPEVLVGVALERSSESLVALLATWKAGGAFVPLSPDYPRERLSYLVCDARPRVLLTQRKFLGLFPGTSAAVVCLDDPEEQNRLAELPAEDFPASASGDNLAYVIYTSGSTGRPKGVEIVQRSLVNHNRAIASSYQLQPSDRVLQFAPLSFDVSLEEILPTWLVGGTVVLRSDEAISSFPHFLQFIEQEKISVLNLPTTFWQELVEHLANGPLPGCVRLVVIGGERASAKAYQKWRQRVPGSVTLVNSYGPTESTITSTCYVAEPGTADLPIGKPIANTCALVLDEKLAKVASGVPGELYLGGAGLARGYRGLPELTAERFIPNPFPSASSARLYRTGDLVCWREDGNLEFIGRIDDQIKIRGFRIEPGEIESALLGAPQLKEAAVAAREDSTGRKRLVAYYVLRPGQKVTVAELRGFLEHKLPGYMIPSLWVAMAALPLSPSGKIERRALPQPPEGCENAGGALQSPRDQTEARLAGIWRDVLRLKRVGVEDDFFSLGGDSLLAMQVIARVRETFDRDLEWNAFFEQPTIAALAENLQNGPAEVSRKRPQLQSVRACGPKLPVSFVQERLWFLQQLFPGQNAYNMGFGLRLKGELSREVLERAVNELGRRHEILRTCIRSEDGELVQVVASSFELRVSDVELSRVPARRREPELLRLMVQEAAKAFDLERLPLVRATLFRLSRQEHVLLLSLHHAICDGWSLSILASELSVFYRSFCKNGGVPQLPAIPLQYADYAAWQRQLLQGDFLAEQLAYWKQKLGGAAMGVPLTKCPAAYEDSMHRASHRALSVPAALVEAAEQVCLRKRLTPFMLLVSALSKALSEISQQRELVIGTVVAGRTRREFEVLVGCFMNFLPLRIKVPEGDVREALLSEVRQAVLEAQAHQDCPFEKIVAAVNPKRQGDRNPLYNVALICHNYPRGVENWGPGLTAESLHVPNETALLDLRLEVELLKNEWLLSCEYKDALFSEAEINSFLDRFSQALRWLLGVGDAPNASVSPARAVPKPGLQRFLARFLGKAA